MAKKKNKQINTNVAAIPWPTDIWGYTAEFRKAFTEMIGKLHGAADKKKLLDEVMELMSDFKENRFNEMNQMRSTPVVDSTNPKTEEKDLKEALFGGK